MRRDQGRRADFQRRPQPQGWIVIGGHAARGPRHAMGEENGRTIDEWLHKRDPAARPRARHRKQRMEEGTC